MSASPVITVVRRGGGRPRRKLCVILLAIAALVALVCVGRWLSTGDASQNEDVRGADGLFALPHPDFTK